VRFESTDAAKPAKFYLLSCPAHARHAAAKINARNATKAVSAGTAAASNVRTLYHLIVSDPGLRRCGAHQTEALRLWLGCWLFTSVCRQLGACQLRDRRGAPPP
jgi:5-keto 4-deoxyuronate isomerase